MTTNISGALITLIKVHLFSLPLSELFFVILTKIFGRNTMLKIILHILIFLLFLTIMFAKTYEVGENKTYINISDVPWESISAGDSVLIYLKASAYKEKWAITNPGTKTNPIVIKGISDSTGEKPVIDGRDATTSTKLNFWNEERGIIKIGGSNVPKDTTPENIIIENLDITSGRPPYSFTGRNGLTNYIENCAAIYIEKGNHILIKDCILHDCGNGLFVSSSSSDIIVQGNYIYDNGIENSIYEHNNYTEASGIIFQFNRFGPLRTGCLGNNLKDRSAGTIIRYNLIEAGNRQLDLVDAGSVTLLNDTSYRKTYVYGNILIEYDDSGNNQIVHYGGDSGDTTKYRNGTLYFYNNTVISYRAGWTTLFRLSNDGENVECFNNIIYTPLSSNGLALLLDNGGIVNVNNNFLSQGWVNSHTTTDANISENNNIEDTDPLFKDTTNFNFELSENSPCINAGRNPDDVVPSIYYPLFEYSPDSSFQKRTITVAIDIGAYEYKIPTSVYDNFNYNNEIIISPNPASDNISISFSNSEFTNASISIFNSLGIVLKRFDEKEVSGRSSMNVSLEDFSPGVYFLTIQAENKTEINKFVIIR
jgi:hypothetical protein